MTADPGADPLEIVRKLGESYRQIRFGRGVVGKTSHATLATVAAWIVVLFRLSDNRWFDVAMIACAIAVTLLCVWWVRGTQRFAKENPGLALLEGAELLEYQKFEAAAKGLPAPQSSPIVPGAIDRDG